MIIEPRLYNYWYQAQKHTTYLYILDWSSDRSHRHKLGEKNSTKIFFIIRKKAKEARSEGKKSFTIGKKMRPRYKNNWREVSKKKKRSLEIERVGMIWWIRLSMWFFFFVVVFFGGNFEFVITPNAYCVWMWTDHTADTIRENF